MARYKVAQILRGSLVTVRTKKLVGMLILTFALALYAVACVFTAITFLPDQWLIELVYYAIVGTVWAIPARALLIWMHHTEDAD
jgi:hypothetical protein